MQRNRQSWLYDLIAKFIVEENVTDLATLLRNQNIDPNQPFPPGKTSIILLAYAFGKGSIVMPLLSAMPEIKIHTRDDENATFLLKCAVRHDQQMVRDILRHFKQIAGTQTPEQNNLDNEQINQVIGYLAKYETKEIVMFFLDNFSHVDYFGLLISANDNKKIDMVCFLLDALKKRINPEIRQALNKLFTWACAENKYELLKKLLKYKDIIDINASYEGKTGLCLAVGRNHKDIVTLLLEQADIQIDIPGEERNAVTIAYTTSETYGSEILTRLLNYYKKRLLKINHHALGKILNSACYTGNCQLVKQLLTLEVDLNYRGEKGATPLYFACQQGHAQIIQLLLEQNNLQLHDPDNIENDPLYIAFLNGHKDAVKLLLQQDRHPLHTSAKTFDAILVLAYRRNWIDIIKILIQKRIVSVNHLNEEGLSQLEIACFKQEFDVVNFLVADPDIEIKKKIRNQSRALSFATLFKRADILEILLEAPNHWTVEQLIQAMMVADDEEECKKQIITYIEKNLLKESSSNHEDVDFIHYAIENDRQEENQPATISKLSEANPKVPDAEELSMQSLPKSLSPLSINDPLTHPGVEQNSTVPLVIPPSNVDRQKKSLPVTREKRSESLRERHKNRYHALRESAEHIKKKDKSVHLEWKATDQFSFHYHSTGNAVPGKRPIFPFEMAKITRYGIVMIPENTLTSNLGKRGANSAKILKGENCSEITLLELSGTRIEGFYKMRFGGENMGDDRIVACDGELLNPGLKGLIIFGFLTDHTYLERLEPKKAPAILQKKIQENFSQALAEEKTNDIIPAPQRTNSPPPTFVKNYTVGFGF